MLCFCTFLDLLDVRICFCPKRANSINTYSMWSFQRALVGFNNLWIHFIFRKINWLSVTKIPGPLLQMEKVAWQVVIFSVPREVIYSFNFLFDIFRNSIYLTFVPKLSFYLAKRVSPIPDMNFWLQLHLFFLNWSYWR